MSKVSIVFVNNTKLQRRQRPSVRSVEALAKVVFKPASSFVLSTKDTTLGVNS